MIAAQQALGGGGGADHELGATVPPRLAEQRPTDRRPQHPPEGAPLQLEVEPPQPAPGKGLPDLFIDARHGEKDRRPHLGQRAGQVVDILQEIDVHRRWNIVGRVGRQDALHHVVHRQGREPRRRPVHRLPGHQRGRAFGHPAQVRVVEHHPLGLAGGPRGVAQGRQVVQVHRRAERRGARAGHRPQRQERLPGDDRVGQLPGRRAPAKGDDGPVRAEPAAQLGQVLHQPGRADQQQLGLAGLEDRLDLGGRAGVIEGHAHRSHQPDGDVQGEVAGAVIAHHRHAVAAADAQRAQGAGGAQDVLAHLAPAAGDRSPLEQVVVGHAPALLAQAKEDLLVDRAPGAMQKAHADRVLEEAREKVAPLERVRSQQPVRVVSLELLPPVQVRQQLGQGRQPAIRTRRGALGPIGPVRQPQREKPDPRQAQVQPLPGPLAHAADQLPGLGQRVVRRGEVEGQPGGAGVEGQGGHRLRHIVHRHQVDPQLGIRREDAQLARQVQPQGGIQRVEGLDRPRARVADDHAGAKDRDGQLGLGGLHQPLPLVLGLLIGGGEAIGVTEGVLRHGTGAAPGHIGGGDVREALQPAVGAGRAGQRQHVFHALDVGNAQLLDRRVQPQVRRRVHDVRHPPGERGVGLILQAEPRLGDVAADDLHPLPDGARQLGPIGPDAAQPPRRRLRALRPHQGHDGAIRILQEPPGDLAAQKARRPREQHRAAHAATSHPRACTKRRSSSRLRFACAVCSTYPRRKRPRTGAGRASSSSTRSARSWERSGSDGSKK